jgi:hypothetical protein
MCAMNTNGWEESVAMMKGIMMKHFHGLTAGTRISVNFKK